MCACLSVRKDISATTRAMFTQFLACCNLHMTAARSFYGRVTKIQGERAFVGVSFPIDNALYSIVFGTRIKTAESIEMPFGMISGLGPRNIVLRGLTVPEREEAIFGKNICPTSLIPLIMFCSLASVVCRRL